jgi:hypothetical protein
MPTRLPCRRDKGTDGSVILGKVTGERETSPTAAIIDSPHDTAEFAAASIRTWLERIGRARYPNMRELTITADCGGSNGARVRLWRVELQKLADETNLTIKVRHYPPGTSKWNKIEHRLFCRITHNWRGRPLTDHATIIELIAATTTKTGLKVESALDTRVYEKGIKISDADTKRLNIRRDAFHPEWNYAVIPRPPKIVAVIVARVLMSRPSPGRRASASPAC